MMRSFTLSYLESHTYEEVEQEGKRRGIWKDVKPPESVMKTIFGYSHALMVFRSGMLGSFSLISN